MPILKKSTRILLGIICLSAFLFPPVVMADSHSESSQTAQMGSELDDAGCLSCHEESEEVIHVPDEADEDEERPLRAIDQSSFQKGVHSDMNCIDCHENIVDSKAEHEKSSKPDPDCANCHLELWEGYKEKELTGELERMGVVVQNIEAFEDSYHAKPARVGLKASCNDCHHAHDFNVPPRGTIKRTDWHLTIHETCVDCHEDAVEDYKTSTHGRELLEEKNLKAATCVDCHTSHAITRTSRDPFQLAITKSCGSCHEEKFISYRDTYHGQINTLGYADDTAKCYDCHGSHEITGVDNPDSNIHPDNLLETCQECHDGDDIFNADENLMSYGPHAHGDDFEKYPEVWIAAKGMHGLLLFVFGYFWLHTLLWWYREYQDRRARKLQQHINTDELGADEMTDNRQVRRFGLAWRIGHLVFALSIMILILTGMAVHYSYTAWAPVVIEFVGGPEMSGLIHRISAAIMLSVFFLHLVGVSVNIYRNRKTFRWFGPDSLIPNWKDFQDAWGMFKWFVNMGPRPTFDRWTYWEKFDYWAVFWGMAIIGGSGVMLTWPEVTAALFPGWVFNVVTLVHGEEAFLATVFLFTVHFFNNHFRPDKLPPPDVVMFTGTQSIEDFKSEHRLQYERLVESGELEKYLVKVPSTPMTIGSKILGIVLLLFGFALLLAVGIGFFGR